MSSFKLSEELGIIKNGEKKNGSKELENKVTDIFNERLQNALSENKDVVINNTNLPKKYRESFLIPALSAGYRIYYHIVEAPDMRSLIERRTGQIPYKAICRMKESFEFPTMKECDKMIIHKQMFDDNYNIITKDYIVRSYIPESNDFIYQSQNSR